jgi:SAM-dependent methyltransferase
MPAEAEVRAFYETAYGGSDAEGLRYARWRALSAFGKADHVEKLLRRSGLEHRTIADIGCGDGALIRELQARGVGAEHTGFEISRSALEIARSSTPGACFEHFDGSALPSADGAFDVGVLSHVLEHVHRPADLLRESARACEALIVEVPLEQNISARRATKRTGAEEIGHVQRFARGDLAALAGAAGLTVAADVSDPLPYSVHAFFADGTAARTRARAKHLMRAGLHAISERVAQRAFTVHYACLMVGPGKAAIRSGPGDG